jgi:carbonic anhydrase
MCCARTPAERHPSVRAVSQPAGDMLGKAIRQNVIDNVAKLASATPILSAAVEQKKLRVVGGIYGSPTAGSIS